MNTCGCYAIYHNKEYSATRKRDEIKLLSDSPDSLAEGFQLDRLSNRYKKIVSYEDVDRVFSRTLFAEYKSSIYSVEALDAKTVTLYSSSQESELFGFYQFNKLEWCLTVDRKEVDSLFYKVEELGKR